MFRESQASNMSFRDAQLCMKDILSDDIPIMLPPPTKVFTGYELLRYKFCRGYITQVKKLRSHIPERNP